MLTHFVENTYFIIAECFINLFIVTDFVFRLRLSVSHTSNVNQVRERKRKLAPTQCNALDQNNSYWYSCRFFSSASNIFDFCVVFGCVFTYITYLISKDGPSLILILAANS